MAKNKRRRDGDVPNHRKPAPRVNRDLPRMMEGVMRELEDKLVPGEPLSPGDVQFFRQLAAITRAASATLDDPAAYRSPWGSMMAAPPGQENYLSEPQYFFSGDHELAFLLARPVKEAGSFTGARASVDALTAGPTGSRVSTLTTVAGRSPGP